MQPTFSRLIQRQLSILYTIFTISCCLLIIAQSAQAQPVTPPTGTIRGRILTTDGKAAADVAVRLLNTTKGTITDETGTFRILNLAEGQYTVAASLVGQQPQTATVDVLSNQTVTLDLTLPETARQLAEVQVKAAKSYNQEAVSIGKIAIRPLDLPQSVVIISRDVLERQQALTLGDALMNVSGVYQMGTTGGNQQELAGRGFAFGSSNTFKNGVRFNNGIMPEVSALERAEIIKGSNALLFGNVAAGGIINLVTKKPQFQNGGSVTMRVGSFGFYKPSLDVFGAINNSQRVAYRLNTTYETANSFRDGVKSERIYINPSLLVKASEKTDILIEGDFLRDNRTSDFGIGAINYTLPNVPRNRFLGAAWSYVNTQQKSLTTTLNHRFSRQWQLRVVGGVQAYNNDLFGTARPNASSQFIQASGKWIRGIQRTQIDETYSVAQADLTGQFETGAIKHALLIGADADQYRTNTTAFNPIARYDSINVFNLDLYRQRTDIPTLTARTLTSAPINRYGIYVQDLVSVTDKIKVLAGLRYSFQQTGSNVLTYADKKTAETVAKDDAISPRFGLVYQPTKTNALFVSYSNSFVLNTGVDITGNALAPSYINQYEAGVKNDLFGGWLTANLTAYQIVNSNVAQTSLDNGNTNANIRELSGEVTSRGIELDLISKTWQGWSVVGGYSYNLTKYTRSNTFVVGSLLRYNPNHTANISLYYTVTSGVFRGLNAGLTGFYFGERVAGRSTRVQVANDAFRLIPVAAFTQLDASVGYSLGNLSIRVKVSNLLNELSYFVHDDNSVNPIAPRQVSATLSYRIW